MTNWINAKCPACGRTDEIDVKATLWVRLTEDGSDADTSEYGGDHEYGDESEAVCNACDHSATFSEFIRPEPAVDSYKIAALCEVAIKEHTTRS